MMAIHSLGETPGSAQASSGIEGVILLSPAHGGPSRIGVPDSKPLASITFNVSNDKGIVGSFTTDGDGRFRIALPPGHYTVSRADAQPRIARFGPFEVDVTGGQMTSVTWSCDSGLR